MNNVAIVVVAYNNADLIVRQVECIRLFCRDSDYDIVIVDNSNVHEKSIAVRYHAERLGCRYVRTFYSEGDSSRSHAFACNASFKELSGQYRYYFYLDHDNFPVKPFSVASILSGKCMAGLGQERMGKKYFWPGCVMWDGLRVPFSLIDFSVNSEYGMDTGGSLYRVVEHFGEESCSFFNEAHISNPQFTSGFYCFYSSINDGMFMHFINSSNWNKSENNTERINSLFNILSDKVALGRLE